MSNRLLNHVIPLNIWLIQIKNILAQHWSTQLSFNFPKCELSFSFTNNFPQLGPFPWKTKVPNFPKLPKLTHSTLSFYSRYSFSLSTSLDPTKLCSLDTFSFHISGSSMKHIHLHFFYVKKNLILSNFKWCHRMENYCDWYALLWSQFVKYFYILNPSWRWALCILVGIW